jgi:hypothetical protein
MDTYLNADSFCTNTLIVKQKPQGAALYCLLEPEPNNFILNFDFCI